MTEPAYIITDEPDDAFTYDAFMLANAEGAEDYAAIGDLEVGESVTFGGGAAPVCVVRRIS